MALYDSHTKLMLHMEDSELNDKIGHIITKVGTPGYDSIIKKFGLGSAYFDGSSGLYTPYSSDFVLGTSNFTFEAQFYCTSYASIKKSIIRQTIYNNANGYGAFALLINTSGKIELFLSSNGSSWNIASALAGTTAISLNTWNHIAFVRSGTKFTVYLNGVAEITVTSTASLYTSTSNYIGIGYSLCSIPQFFSGYIDEVRVAIGIAIWEDNFIPPTSPYGITYLLKSANSYYSINQLYYDISNKTYLPLSLLNIEPDLVDINNYGFSIEDLTKLNTINGETFKPIDRLYSSFEIKEYKSN